MVWAAALPEAREWAGAAVHGRKLGKGSLVTPAVPPGNTPAAEVAIHARLGSTQQGMGHTTL
jgi:hypothetical protein